MKSLGNHSKISKRFYAPEIKIYCTIIRKPHEPFIFEVQIKHISWRGVQNRTGSKASVENLFMELKRNQITNHIPFAFVT